jgi:LysM repeat protein
MKESPCFFHQLLFCLLALVLCACQPARPSPTPLAPTLAVSPSTSPSPTSTLTATPLPPPTATPVPLPSVTPTPVTHTVKKGEDFGGIAFTYHITLKALMEANPKVNPNLMSVGTVLVIPTSTNPSDPSTTVTAQPTAVPIQLSQPACYAILDGSLDCMALVTNPLTIFVESVSVTFRLANLDTGEIISNTATTPLNLVPPGWAMPLHYVFQAPIPKRYQAGVELNNALPYTASDQRYINVHLENRQDAISPDGLSAVLQGDLILEGKAENKAGVTWVAAAAFDKQNQLVGLRRWEASAPLIGGQPAHFLMNIYSAGPVIDHFTLLAEARR